MLLGGSMKNLSLAQSLNPEVKIPKKVPYSMMLLAAHMMQLKSKITKKQPMMMPHLVKSFYKAKKRYETSKAKRDLGFNPRSQIAVIKEKMRSAKESTMKFLSRSLHWGSNRYNPHLLQDCL
jgi:hypothetical protein